MTNLRFFIGVFEMMFNAKRKALLLEAVRIRHWPTLSRIFVQGQACSLGSHVKV